MKKMREIEVNGTSVRVVTVASEDYICLTDMLKSKDGDFFFSDWLRNRNTVEFLGVWERVNNPNFNYGEFAIIKNQAGLNSYKLSAKEWMAKTHASSGRRSIRISKGISGTTPTSISSSASQTWRISMR